MSKKLIGVNLYGGKGLFGGKETPLEASQIFCDMYDSCSYFQNNQCLCVRSFGGSGCKFGHATTERGYTSKAKKYHEFKRKWESHENYRKLTYPPRKLGVIDGIVVIPYAYVYLEKENDKWQVKGPMFFGSETSYVPLNEFSPDLIKRICEHRPCAMTGGEITNYQKEVVPLFLAHLSEVIPDRYQDFIDAYPQSERQINHVGRKALLKTIAPSTVEYKSDRYPQFNESWDWDGERLIYQKGHVSDFRITKNYEVERIEIVPSEQSVITITSNDQVTSKTIFED